ncbi:hypothetical protein DD705_11000, partial [Bifidobacterium longum]
MFSPRPEGRSLHKPNKMTVDRNNRSHKPKGTPEGGRYEGNNPGAGADEGAAPTPGTGHGRGG